MCIRNFLLLSQRWTRAVLLFWPVAVVIYAGQSGGDLKVDFRYHPPQWQASVCLPDDPHKTLVDKTGELLYHYRQGGREFGTRVSVVVDDKAVWRKQELLSPQIPIVRTRKQTGGLQILEEAFAVTDLPDGESKTPLLVRLDTGGVQQNWANPPDGVDPSLRHIALHYDGSIKYAVSVKKKGAYDIALVLCEGWWSETGQRVQRLSVEGAEAVIVDTVKDLGKNKPGAFWFSGRDVDGDGRITVRIDATEKAGDKNTILNGMWVFDSKQKRDDAALLAGGLNGKAETYGIDAPGRGPSRNDLLLVTITNTAENRCEVSPRVVVDTTLGCTFDEGRSGLVVRGHELVTSSRPLTEVEVEDESRYAASLGKLTIDPGASKTLFVLYSAGTPVMTAPATVGEARACRREAQKYWETAEVPKWRISVPDPGIQALLDSSIRNIWQAREIKKGLPAFQVGPTCYRGLWIVDGAFLLEAAALMGAGDEARSGVAYELTFQREDGRIQVMNNYSKENGIVLWTCLRHARLTQDKMWLESIWPKLTRVAEHIKRLRRETLTNDTPLDDGLVPPGFPDGGIGGVHAEYTNPYWNLLGLRAFIDGAKWLGKSESAAEWQREYDAFIAAFRKAAARDMKTDQHGNRYLPIRMDGRDLPQRGQWGFCHAVYPGQIFPKDDPLVEGNMKMLEATEREGMVYGTGWDPTGIWNYFASFYGHAWLWQGNGRKAAEALYAFANHAAPVLVWREEQSLKGHPFRKVGDMPHNWASAEFIRLAVHLLALDRGDELHLFEGLPREWCRPGMQTSLNGVATPFGPLTLSLRINKSGREADLVVNKMHDLSCKAIVVHLGGWASSDPAKTVRLKPEVVHRIVITVDEELLSPARTGSREK